MYKKIILFLLLFSQIFFQTIFASVKNEVTVDMQRVSLQDAIRFFAKQLQINVVMSPKISGLTSLHFPQINKNAAFDLLLLSNHLFKKQMGEVWYIAPREEWIARQQDELKLKTTIEESAPLLTRVWQMHYAKAEDVAHILQDNTNSLLSKRGHIRVDTRTNILCVQDTFAHLLEVQRVISRLDIPVQQVLIEARLASIDSDYERELGIDFVVQQSQPHTRTRPEESVLEPVSRRFGLAVAKLADGAILDIKLSALEADGHGELISSPTLFTANQQTASIESGEEIPYQEISRSGATGVAFKKAVLSLKVTPQIMPGNKVLLQLQVNQDKPSSRIVQGVPAISTRQISTNVLVADRQTIVLGGIYETNKENSQQRIPFLGKIPFLGWLFQQQNVRDNKRELLIFVTPKIIAQNIISNDKVKR